jgi:hypothetical protein
MGCLSAERARSLKNVLFYKVFRDYIGSTFFKAEMIERSLIYAESLSYTTCSPSVRQYKRIWFLTRDSSLFAF